MSIIRVFLFKLLLIGSAGFTQAQTPISSYENISILKFEQNASYVIHFRGKETQNDIPTLRIQCFNYDNDQNEIAIGFAHNLIGDVKSEFVLISMINNNKTQEISIPKLNDISLRGIDKIDSPTDSYRSFVSIMSMDSKEFHISTPTLMATFDKKFFDVAWKKFLALCKTPYLAVANKSTGIQN